MNAEAAAAAAAGVCDVMCCVDIFVDDGYSSGHQAFSLPLNYYDYNDSHFPDQKESSTPTICFIGPLYYWLVWKASQQASKQASY